MSYCRWSDMDHQCDLYCYESDDGFMTHVACNRPVFKEPLPDPVSLTPDNVAEWMARRAKVDAMLDSVERKPIGGPCDGETFSDASPVAFLRRLYHLRESGYQFPDYVLDAVRSEIEERAA